MITHRDFSMKVEICNVGHWLLRLFLIFGVQIRRRKGGVGMVDIHSDEYILGQNIRKYRKQKGWSQKDLSDAVDMDRANISGIENGERGVMSCVTLRKFAQALGVTMDALMEEN